MERLRFGPKYAFDNCFLHSSMCSLEWNDSMLLKHPEIQGETSSGLLLLSSEPDVQRSSGPDVQPSSGPAVQPSSRPAVQPVSQSASRRALQRRAEVGERSAEFVRRSACPPPRKSRAMGSGDGESDRGSRWCHEEFETPMMTRVKDTTTCDVH